jgi:hypothetical protein
MAQLLLVALLALPAVAAYANGFPPDATADQPFVCDYRKLAWEFAKKVQPSHDATLTFDALMLGSLCNETRPSPTQVPAPAALDSSACAIFVDVGGDDAQSGTTSKTAKATLAAGIAATRTGASGAKTLCVGVGTFYLDAPLQLTAADSGLTIQGETPSDGRGGRTWISGAVALPKLQWKQSKVAPAKAGTLSELTNTNVQAGCSVGDPSPIASGGCGCYSNSSTAASCKARCATMGASKCQAYGWSPFSGSHWSEQCCIHADTAWKPSTGPSAKGHVSGHWAGAVPAANVWKANLPAGTKLPPASQLRVGGVRSSRARFPDSNPETDIWPHGWVPDAQTWLPAKPPKSKPLFVSVLNKEIQSRNDGLTLNQSKPYSGGIGGPCEVFDPPFSYWCSAHPAGGGGFQYYVPSGMELPNSTFPSGLEPRAWSKQGRGATVHAFRRSHWASWMFDVSSVGEDSESQSPLIHFGKGGYQGCRGGPGQDWFVENVLELLDSNLEHYYDEETNTLYYQPNATSTVAPAADLQIHAPVLQALVVANATQGDPIKGLTLRGLGFRDAAPTFMEAHGVPSGGDWGLERLGALFFEGTEDLKIAGCQFERLDGNGLMLSGYHRRASIVDSHWAWTGGTAIAAWGRTDELSDGGIHGWDATPGNVPHGTTVSNCIMRESGIWEKQSSCFFQAKTAATTLTNNLCFNLPRAGFNFNDGLGGGEEVHHNL